MNITINDDISKKSKTPHNIFLLNLTLIHLLMTPATLILKMGISGLLIPLAFSLLIMLYSLIKMKSIDTTEHWFVYAHWRLALNRYRLLLISYGVTLALLIIGWLISRISPDPNMQDIIYTVFIRISVMPTLLMVLVNFFLESSALSMAARGEIADTIVNQLPENIRQKIST
ncbi:MAG: hypothetical protein OQK98_13040 [Gammaproteobacteria bacterium]|nr:hypothetical protein [Gammaproteobacteria bacterium]